MIGIQKDESSFKFTIDIMSLTYFLIKYYHILVKSKSKTDLEY